MKVTLHKVAATAALVLSANLAWAAPITIDTVANPKLLGPNYISLSFGSTFVRALNIISNTSVSALDPASVNGPRRPSNGKLISLSIEGMDLRALSVDDETGGILGLQYGGGFRLSATDDDLTTTGGSLSVSNLKLDLVNKQISGSIEGGNGVGSVDNIALWDVATIGGATVLPLNSWRPYADGSGRSDLSDATFDTRLSGLTITRQGFDLWSQSMGYNSLGKDGLATITNFGTITTSAVPEPGSSALAIFGLSALGVAARRRA
jgi:PEP-CTERM motif-containing protein